MAQALSLAESLKKNQPNSSLTIGLVDKKSSEIDYDNFSCQVIEASEIGVPDFDSLWKKYDIIEFNTAVKPFFFKYLIQKHTEENIFIYLDPDTYLFNNFSSFEEDINNASIVLTPHIYQTVKGILNKVYEKENIFLNFGIYNLGFLAVNTNFEETTDILNWWGDRTLEYCYIQPEKGLFTDQIWFNFAPIFFKHTKITRHKGLNVAPWNIHERNIIVKEDTYFVENNPLVFWHFSGFRPNEDLQVSQGFTTCNFENSPQLLPIHQEYQQKMLGNKYNSFIKIESHYSKLKREYEETLENDNLDKDSRSLLSKIKNKIKAQLD